MNLPLNYQVKAEMCKRDFFFFVKEFWDVIIAQKPVYNWHIPYLCGELQAVAERVKTRLPKQYDLVINIPPGTTKSTIVTIMFPVWCWTVDPSLKFITSSYSSDLSISLAVKSRDIINSDKFKQYFPYLELKEDNNNKSAYENNYMGSRVATSTGGTITGKHADIIINDDPINPKKAASEVERNTANEFIDQSLSTRKTDKEVTVMIHVMQRLHEKDCTGHLLAKSGKEIKHICLPAELSDDVKPIDLRIKYADGLLDPVRLSRKALAGERINLGSYGYSGQMMQRPSPDEGGIIKKHWFNIINQDEFNKASEKKLFVWDFFIDSAYTKKTTNDPTAIMAVARIDNFVYVRKSAQFWLELPQLLDTIPQFVRANGYSRASRIFIEPKASGISIRQMIKTSTHLNVVDLEAPKDDKVTRVHSVSPIIEAGRVFLIEGDWAPNFLNECGAFPNGTNDDQVDNLTAMLDKYFSKKTAYKAPKITLFRK